MKLSLPFRLKWFFDWRDVDIWTRVGLWFVAVCAVASSFTHVSAMFGNGDRNAGALPALAVDGGLMVSTYALARFESKWVKVGFWVFLLLSIFANLDYTLQSVLGGAVTWNAIWTLDPWQMVKVIAQASPPLLGAMMMEINVALAKLPKRQPKPSTALTPSTPKRQPVQSTAPDVTVDKPQPAPSTPRQRRINRAADRRLTTGTAPTMPRLNRQPERQPVPLNQPSTSSTSDHQPQTRAQFNHATDIDFGLVELFDDEESAPQPAGVEEVEPVELMLTDLNDETLKGGYQAIESMANGMSLQDIAAEQGISPQGVRTRMRSVYKRDPEYVTAAVPDWVKSSQNFLNK